MLLPKSKWLHGLHEGHEGGLSYYKDKHSWIVFTEEVGHDPKDFSGKDFSSWANLWYWPVVRLNNGYGSSGTIPAKQFYSDFATRIQNYVRASKGAVYYWIIGNEPNHSQEWPDNQPISAEDYVECFRLCRSAIKNLAGHRGDMVIPAPIAPWNVESGDWLAYYNRVLVLLEPDGCDGIALHSYTHGSDVALVTSEAKMDPPYQDRHYHFRAYQDFMARIPLSMRHLPVLITECDQNDAWDNRPNTWIQRAYQEISAWNTQSQNQTIQCLAMYRFPAYDKWSMVDKNDVLADFTRSVDGGYLVPEPRILMPETVLFQVKIMPLLLNVRNKADITGQIVGSRAKDNQIDVLEVSKDGLWYRIGPDQWVSSAWVTPLSQSVDNTAHDWDRCLAFVLKWEGGWADNPLDKGGATMRGITFGTYTGWRKLHGQPTPTKDELHNISDTEVHDIYYNKYWTASGADRMIWPMNLAHLDLAVNGGVDRAQNALALMGNNFWDYMTWRRDWYKRLDDFDTFGEGWLNRCKDLIMTAYE